MNIDWWWLPFIVLGTIFAVRIFLAPYWMQKDAKAKYEAEIEKVTTEYKRKIADLTLENVELRRMRNIPLVEEAAEAQVAWGLYHTGVTIRQNKNTMFPKLKKPLLPEPSPNEYAFRHLTADTADNVDGEAGVVALTSSP